MRRTAALNILCLAAVVCVLLPSARAIDDIDTPIASVGLGDVRGSSCNPQLPVCFMDIRGDPRTDPGGTTIFVDQRYDSVHADLRAPVAPRESINQSLEHIDAPNPLWSAANGTLAEIPDGPLRGYESIFINSSGAWVFYEGLSTQHPEAGTGWYGRSVFEFNDSANNTDFMNYTNLHVPDRFVHDDTDNDGAGTAMVACERVDDVVAAVCGAAGAPAVLSFVVTASPNVIMGADVPGARVTEQPPIDQAAPIDGGKDPSPKHSGSPQASDGALTAPRRSNALPDPPLKSGFAADTARPALAPIETVSRPHVLRDLTTFDETPFVSIGKIAATAATLLSLAVFALYHRLTRNEALTQENRARLLDELRRNQRGATVAQLARTMELDPTTVLYHLTILARHHAVTRLQRGDLKLWTLPEYASLAPVEEESHALRTGCAREVARLFAQAHTRRELLNIADVSQRLGLTRSTAWWHVARLEETGFLVARHIPRDRSLRYEVTRERFAELAELATENLPRFAPTPTPRTEKETFMPPQTG
ncbi:MAG: winged helix-turn-helix transcriptional regulator [Thermoplasmatota archaeon]